MAEKSEKVAADYTILAVDDSEDMRVLLYELLHEEEEYIVLLAENGQEALDKTMLHHPDLILMDMSLPGMDGWEVVKHLRNMDEFRTTPIIAVTAHTAKGDAERSLAVGCTGHVNKPFDILVLLEQIEGAIQ